MKFLKWYSFGLLVFAIAFVFVDFVNTRCPLSFSAFILQIPILVYILKTKPERNWIL